MHELVFPPRTSTTAGFEDNYSPLAVAVAAFAVAVLACTFLEDFFGEVVAAARFAAHRFFSAATIAFLPSGDNFRFGFLAPAAGVSPDAAFFSDQRRF